MNRRNRRFTEKKPKSTDSLIYAGIGLASIVAYLVVILIAAGLEGMLANFLGGISMLCMLLSIYIFVRGIQISKNENFNKSSRVAGVVVPGIAAALWILLYIIGIFMG